jgi:hypothetical protein
MQISLAALNRLAMKSISPPERAVSVINGQCGARLRVCQGGRKELLLLRASIQANERGRLRF